MHKSMAQYQIRRLPIVNRDKRVVGILALGDVAVKERKTKPAAEALRGVPEPVAAWRARGLLEAFVGGLKQRPRPR